MATAPSAPAISKSVSVMGFGEGEEKKKESGRENLA